MKILLATAITALAMLGTGTAHADPNVNDLICQEMRMGMSPDGITRSIQGGQSNVPPFIVRGRVLNQLGDCDQSTP